MSSWAVFSDADFNPKVESEVNFDDEQAGDPWSAEAWPELPALHPATPSQQHVERDIFDMALDVFAEEEQHDTPTSRIVEEQNAAIPQVDVALHEQLSCLYSDKDEPESQVNGSIHVRPEEGAKDSFCFVVKDLTGQIEQFQETRNCTDITDTIPFSKTQVGDRVLRVTSESSTKQSIVATYTCSNVVHPIPLLVKSKVQVIDDYCRIGLKMRANPTNNVPLTNGTMLLAVPPDIRGDSIRTSRQGGIWDEMKRVVSWPLDDIEPGKLFEIQAQFEFEASASKQVTPKFPVLLRCDAKNEQFSDIRLTTDVNDNQFRPIKLKVSRSVRILHRKV